MSCSSVRAPRPLTSAAPLRNYRLVVTAFAVVAAYVVLLPLLGFRLATVLFVAALQAALGPAAHATATGRYLPRSRLVPRR